MVLALDGGGPAGGAAMKDGVDVARARTRDVQGERMDYELARLGHDQQLLGAGNRRGQVGAHRA